MNALSKQYGSMRWKRKRAQQLAAAPLCVFCKARDTITPATVADHIEAHRGDESAFWDNELQSLCAHCHNSVKQSMEKGGNKPKFFGSDGYPVE